MNFNTCYSWYKKFGLCIKVTYLRFTWKNEYNTFTYSLLLLSVAVALLSRIIKTSMPETRSRIELRHKKKITVRLPTLSSYVLRQTLAAFLVSRSDVCPLTLEKGNGEIIISHVHCMKSKNFDCIKWLVLIINAQFYYHIWTFMP